MQVITVGGQRNLVENIEEYEDGSVVLSGVSGVNASGDVTKANFVDYITRKNLNSLGAEKFSSLQFSVRDLSELETLTLTTLQTQFAISKKYAAPRLENADFVASLAR